MTTGEYKLAVVSSTDYWYSKGHHHPYFFAQGVADYCKQNALRLPEGRVVVHHGHARFIHGVFTLCPGGKQAEFPVTFIEKE